MELMHIPTCRLYTRYIAEWCAPQSVANIRSKPRVVCTVVNSCICLTTLTKIAKYLVNFSKQVGIWLLLG